MTDHTERSHRVRGYCALCTAHCATIATVEDGKVTRLDADHDHPNGGVLCIKGKAAPELVYHPDRLNYPFKRTRPKGDADPGWQRVSWDQALDEIAERLISIREALRCARRRLGQRHTRRHIRFRCGALAGALSQRLWKPQLGIHYACL